MPLYFVPTESAFAYFEATRAYLEQHGKPVAFYSDKASIFRAVRDSTDFGRGTTQFGRVLFELNRLVKELRLRGINTREAANAFAPHFIADFNARFAKAPLREFDGHRPVRADEELDLLFTWRPQRPMRSPVCSLWDTILPCSRSSKPMSSQRGLRD